MKNPNGPSVETIDDWHDEMEDREAKLILPHKPPQIESAFREGYEEGYQHGSEDCANRKSNVDKQSRKADEESAWMDSDAKNAQPLVSHDDPSPGCEMIYAERQRQMWQEGYSPEHDDAHTKAQMTKAAMAYCSATVRQIKGINQAYDGILWPSEWEPKHFKPSHDPIRNLVKAGALIAAEIDRLKRAKL